MKRCLTRVLGGIACTIGVLALSMGTAHADENDQGLGLDGQISANATAKGNVAAKASLPKVKAVVAAAASSVMIAWSTAR